MPYADGKLKRRVRARRNDLFMMSSELSFTPSAPKPSLPVLDDAHVLTDKSGAVASLEQLVTSLNCLLARSELGPQSGVIRIGTEDFSGPASAASGRNVAETTDAYMYDVLVWTCQNKTMRVLALLDTQCGPNLIREDIVQEAGLHIRRYLGPSLSQVDGSYYMPAGQVTTRIHFCGGKRTFKIDFLLAPSNAGYDILLGGPFISKARLLLCNPAGFVLMCAGETLQQTAERQGREREAQRASEQIERQRAEQRRQQRARERETAEEQRRQKENERSSRRG